MSWKHDRFDSTGSVPVVCAGCPVANGDHLSVPEHPLRCGPETSVTSPLRWRWFELSGHENIYPVVEVVGMWESRRDFQRVWEGWEAGFLAFHTLSFPWPAFRPGGAGFTVISINARGRTRKEVFVLIVVDECFGDLH